MSRSTKYALTNIGLAVMLYLAYRYYRSAGLGATDPEKFKKHILAGIALFIACGVVILLRAYYRSQRGPEKLAQSQEAADLGALGSLGEARLKKTALRLTVTDKELRDILSTNVLVLSTGRFKAPVRYGDKVWVYLDNTEGETNARFVNTIVEAIDGVNQRITLKRMP